MTDKATQATFVRTRPTLHEDEDKEGCYKAEGTKNDDDDDNNCTFHTTNLQQEPNNWLRRQQTAELRKYALAKKKKQCHCSVISNASFFYLNVKLRHARYLLNRKKI